jgi:hypothetical protein
MVEENIRLDEVLQAIATGEVLEDYPSTGGGPVACSAV